MKARHIIRGEHPAFRSTRPAPAVQGAVHCFHCAEPLPPGTEWSAEIDGAMRQFCCAGCLAVAQTIRQAGLDTYYQRRDVPARAPPSPTSAATWRGDDAIARRSGVLRDRADGIAEISLLLEGVTCGACIWLIETWLGRLAGVHAVRVNYALHRAEVEFDPRVVSVSQLLDAVAAIGYSAHPYDPLRRERIARSEARALLRRTAIALLAMMQVMMLALPGYLSVADVAPEARRLLDWASLTLTLPVIIYCAAPFFRGAWRDVRAGHLGMDVPIVLALAAAFGGSVTASLRGHGATYYDSITMFVALLLAARLFELHARQRAAEQIERTSRAMPATAERYRGARTDSDPELIAAEQLASNDVVLVRPGAAVPGDGVVIDGRSHVDEAWLTGESEPRPIQRGATVLAGSINHDGALVVRVTRAGEATQIAALGRLVAATAASRPRIAREADRVASVFVATMLVLTGVVAVVWWMIEPARTFEVVFALLAVACPCALSLATPATLAAAAGALARRQIVLARPEALENLARVDTAAFDKTGTLTHGRLQLAHFVALRTIDEQTALAIAAALERGSEHPIARALHPHAADGIRAKDVLSITGQGVEGEVGGTRWRLGRPRPDADVVVEACIARKAAPSTVVALEDGAGTAALIGLADTVRDDAAATVAGLRARGIASTILSGDRSSTVQAVATATGIGRAMANLTPQGKCDAIARLQLPGGRVVMVGDGVNDAPALARADVAVSLGASTPLAQCTADAVLLRGRLTDLLLAIDVARKARRVLRQNLAWALGYNLIAIPAAALGLVTPLLASVGMSLSSLIVVANGLRAARVKED